MNIFKTSMRLWHLQSLNPCQRINPEPPTQGVSIHLQPCVGVWTLQRWKYSGKVTGSCSGVNHPQPPACRHLANALKISRTQRHSCRAQRTDRQERQGLAVCQLLPEPAHLALPRDTGVRAEHGKNEWHIRDWHVRFSASNACPLKPNEAPADDVRVLSRYCHRGTIYWRAKNAQFREADRQTFEGRFTGRLPFCGDTCQPVLVSHPARPCSDSTYRFICAASSHCLGDRLWKLPVFLLPNSILWGLKRMRNPPWPEVHTQSPDSLYASLFCF